jgi:mannosyltransferase OCH1-like enzyme
MEVVEKCVESWKFYNPSYKVVILNKSNCRHYIDDDIDSIKHGKDSMARFSDYVRLCVLAKYGGFWIDASIICHHPFTWLHGVQKNWTWN